jgi:hypothetical protein
METEGIRNTFAIADKVGSRLNGPTGPHVSHSQICESVHAIIPVGPPPRGSIGLGYSFDKRVFRQVLVVLTYNCLGLL